MDWIQSKKQEDSHDFFLKRVKLRTHLCGVLIDGPLSNYTNTILLLPWEQTLGGTAR